MGCLFNSTNDSDPNKNLNSSSKTLNKNDLKNKKQEENVHEKFSHCKRVVALYSYRKKLEDQLNFEKGDNFRVLDDNDTDWWVVIHELTLQEGVIPSNYCKPYQEKSTENNLEDNEWFFPHVSRQEAQCMLALDGKPGTFLIRVSENNPNMFALAVNDDNCKIRNFRIIQYPGGVGVHEEQIFPTLAHFVDYFKNCDDPAVPRLRQSAQKGVPELASLGKDIWDIDRSQIKLIAKLGEGNYGDVFKAVFIKNQEVVAVKKLKENTMKLNEFLSEANLMKTIRHQNLVALRGVCKDDYPILIVFEFMKNGSLKDFLPYRVNKLDLSTLMVMCAQICKGMKYIESINMIHRDLAARNVLISEKYVCKIGDFGLAQKVEKNGDVGNCHLNFPVKWTAPEAIHHGIFSNKSDVWSYGVLMWEIFTYCETPYVDMNNQQAIKYILEGKILGQPQNCPDSVYEIMKLCFSLNPENRPSFNQIQPLLKESYEKEKINEIDTFYTNI